MPMLPHRDWLDMTWEDFSQADPAGWVAVLPIAAVEQHGPHLPLGTDTFIAQTYLARVRAELPDDLPVSFLPVQQVGASEEHRAFPGTLSMTPETLLRALAEIGNSVHRAGVRRLVIVSSHGGNSEVMRLAARDLRVRRGMLAVTTSWHRMGYPDGLFADAERSHGIHAGEIETAIMLAARPQSVRADKAADFASRGRTLAQQNRFSALDDPGGLGWMTQDINPTGAVGNAAAATAAQGEAALAHGARAFIDLLREVAEFDLARLAPGPLGAASEP